ncbi:hypothetical protein B484DRAFT_394124 [Ochromonadaceae sp. CCMP2298]|nr:hypothetical protein B484DRAFT_394124 [Ochromonadaceae sp. CCMP2298]
MTPALLTLFLFVVVLLLAQQGPAQAFSPSRSAQRHTLGRPLQPEIMERGWTSLRMAEASSSKTNEGGEPFKKFACRSCSYIYDEEKGFKKRYPPGTMFSSLTVFMCPVCGAAIDQFHPVADEQ